MIDSGSTIIVTHRANAGVLAGIFGCVFGVLGIFTFGMVFVPLAAVCAVIGLLRGLGGGSASGIGASVLAGTLSVIGFSVSPSLWILAGGALLASHLPGPTPSAINEMQARPTINEDQTNRERTFQREQQFVSGLNSLFQHVDRSRQYAKQQLAKFPSVERHYLAITSAMGAYLDRERLLVNNPIAAARRGQISVAISQGLNATEQLHNRVLALQQNFFSNAGPLLKAVGSYEHACRDGFGNDVVNPSLTDARNSLCARLFTEAPDFRHDFNLFAVGLEHLEAIYRQEIARETDLERESLRIE